MANKTATKDRAPASRASNIDGAKISDDMKKTRNEEETANEKELKAGHYWEISLPHQPCVKVKVDTKDDEETQKANAIAMYNRWASITSTDHKYTTTKVPAKGPRLHVVEITKENPRGDIVLN